MDEPPVTTSLLTRQHTVETRRATAPAWDFFELLGHIGHRNGRTTIRIMATAISTAVKPSRPLEIRHVSGGGDEAHVCLIVALFDFFSCHCAFVCLGAGKCLGVE